MRPDGRDGDLQAMRGNEPVDDPGRDVGAVQLPGEDAQRVVLVVHGRFRWLGGAGARQPLRATRASLMAIVDPSA